MNGAQGLALPKWMKSMFWFFWWLKFQHGYATSRVLNFSKKLSGLLDYTHHTTTYLMRINDSTLYIYIYYRFEWMAIIHWSKLSTTPGRMELNGSTGRKESWTRALIHMCTACSFVCLIACLHIINKHKPVLLFITRFHFFIIMTTSSSLTWWCNATLWGLCFVLVPHTIPALKSSASDLWTPKHTSFTVAPCRSTTGSFHTGFCLRH